MTWTVLPFEQPAGRFYAGVVDARELLSVVKFHERHFDTDTLSTSGGVQRGTATRRVLEIAEYAASLDASFPTSIVVAVPAGSYELTQRDSTDPTYSLEFLPDRGKSLTVIDGQHRLKGLANATEAVASFQLPVVFVLEPTEEEMAFMFATINGKQVPVSKSLIYDLFEVTQDRSPQKTAHEIARELNADPDSPWFRRIKMLGRKTPGSEESLSQGTLVGRLLPLISAHPDEDLQRILRRSPVEPSPRSVFNQYYMHDEDRFIYRVLLNYFTAAKSTWPDEWTSRGYLLTKAVGFSGMVMALERIAAAGREQGDMSQEFFKRVFAVASEAMRSSGRDWKSFGSSGKGAAEIAKFLTDALSSVMSGPREPEHSS